MLGLTLDSWNNLMVGCLLVAASFGVAAAIATYCVVRLQGIESADQIERIEQLRKANLELQKQVRGREISDEQHDQVISAAKGLKVPDLVTYIVPDPEARMYGLSLSFLFQELGMPGRIVMMDESPPAQTGVMYCGNGTPEDRAFVKILMDAGIVGIGAPDARPPNMGHDKDGKEIVLSYCPPGSIFVGLRNPLSTVRMPLKTP